MGKGQTQGSAPTEHEKSVIISVISGRMFFFLCLPCVPWALLTIFPRFGRPPNSRFGCVPLPLIRVSAYRTPGYLYKRRPWGI